LLTELEICFLTQKNSFSGLGTQLACLSTTSLSTQLRDKTAAIVNIMLFEHCSMCSDKKAQFQCQFACPSMLEKIKRLLTSSLATQFQRFI
jgi:hypothetical protein